MNRLLISYDLVAPGQNYDDLIDYLEGYAKHAHPLMSVWLVGANKSTDTVRDEIAALLDKDDKVIVVDTTGKAASWRPAGLDWLKNDDL